MVTWYNTHGKGSPILEMSVGF